MDNERNETMTRGELMEMLVKYLRQYRSDGVIESVKRNSHMNDYKGEKISQESIDAVLVDFVNFVGMQQGIDLALYAADLPLSPTASPPSGAGE